MRRPPSGGNGREWTFPCRFCGDRHRSRDEEGGGTGRAFKRTGRAVPGGYT